MNIFKTGIAFLYGTFTHYILIIIWTEHIWNIQRLNGGVGGTVLENINPMLNKLIRVEFVISIFLIIFGIFWTQVVERFKTNEREGKSMKKIPSNIHQQR